MEKKIIIGTRGSILAVAQAETVKNMLLEKFPDLEIELKKIVTSGDRDQSNNWGEESLKSLFVKTATHRQADLVKLLMSLSTRR